MDNDHAHALEPLAKKFEDALGIQVRIETPENITNTFPLAAQAGKGPDIVIWAHDKLGEWADAGLIGHVEISDGFGKKFFLKAWLYNKRLLEGYPPATLADLVPLNHEIKAKRSGVTTILWDYKSAYYSWGILASAGAYVFANTGSEWHSTMALAGLGVVSPLAKRYAQTIILGVAFLVFGLVFTFVLGIFFGGQIAAISMFFVAISLYYQRSLMGRSRSRIGLGASSTSSAAPLERTQRRVYRLFCAISFGSVLAFAAYHFVTDPREFIPPEAAADFR